MLDRPVTLVNLNRFRRAARVGRLLAPLTPQRPRNQNSQKKSHKKKTKISFCLQNPNGVVNRFFLGTSRPLRQQGMLSVHPLPAVHGATVTRDLVLVVLEVELIVVAELPTAKTQSEKGRRRPRPASAQGPQAASGAGVRPAPEAQRAPRGCRKSSHCPCGPRGQVG